MKNEIKHSEDFITRKVGKQSGFSVSSDYFDDVAQNIDAKILLENFDKKTAFKVPDNYFDCLDNEILNAVSPAKKTTKIVSFKDRFLKVIPYAAAASILLFVGLNTFIFNSDKEFTFDSISDADIEFWLEENSVSTIEVATILSDEILDVNSFTFTNINDEHIEDYINSIDNSSLLDELN